MSVRVGRPTTKSQLKAKGVVPDVSTMQSSNTNDAHNNIFVQVFGTSADVSDAVPLDNIVEAPVIAIEGEKATDAQVQSTELVIQDSTVNVPMELEDIDKDLVGDDAKLKRFRATTNRHVEFTVNVEFLKQVIHVLINNHNIAITADDIKAIMSFFGETEIRMKRRKIVERSGDVGCCKAVDREKFVEVIHKILVLGVNISKYVPALVEFLAELGLNL